MGWSSVACAEEAGTQSESYDDKYGIMKASVTLRCAYADRHLLVADVCGNRTAWPKGSAGPAPLAATASITPVLTPDPNGTLILDDQGISYGEALVTINYTTEIVDVVSESIEPTVEFITLDHRNFCWGSGRGTQLREEEAPGRLVRGINFVRTELDRTTLPGNLLSLIGYTNTLAVTGSILGLTFPAGTLLYAPPSISYKKDSAGGVKYDVTKKFTYNQNGWNYYFRSAAGGFQAIYRRGAAVPYLSYPVGDLSALFT